jgi:hypothetical protein
MRSIAIDILRLRPTAQIVAELAGKGLRGGRSDARGSGARIGILRAF